MPVIVPIVPHMQQQPPGPPSWLRLAAGETFVRSYGGGASGSNRQKKLLLVTLVAGLLVAAQGGFLVAYKAQTNSAAAEVTSGSPTPYIAIAIVSVLVIVGALVLKIAMLKRGSTNAVLTSKRMMFKVGKEVTGFKLGEIVRLQPAAAKRGNGIQVYIRQYKEPAVTLPVDSLETALAELTAYSVAAGAKLR